MNQNLSDVAENWYARLNRLKENHFTKEMSTEKRAQSARLIAEMIVRMMRIAPHYIEAYQKRFQLKPGFQPGGVILK